MKLYEITEAYVSLEENYDGENLKEMLDSIKDEFNLKAENIVKVIKNLDGDIEALKNEEKRLADKRRSLEKQKEDLKEYLFYNMQATNSKKIKAGIFDINIQKNPQSIKIIDEAIIPEKYKIASYRLDKQALKNDLKDGVEIEGASLEQKEGLRIR